MKNKISIIIISLLAGVIIGWFFFHSSPGDKTDSELGKVPADTAIWTCSMHPQIRMDEPGKCPICGMDLVPGKSGAISLPMMHPLCI